MVGADRSNVAAVLSVSTPKARTRFLVILLGEWLVGWLDSSLHDEFEARDMRQMRLRFSPEILDVSASPKPSCRPILIEIAIESFDDASPLTAPARDRLELLPISMWTD